MNEAARLHITMDLNSDDIARFVAWAKDFTELTTPRLVVRPLTLADDEALFDALKNPRVNTWISVFQQPFDLSAMRRWLTPRIERMEQHEGIWAGVYHHGSTHPMGWVFAGLEPDLGGVELAGALGELYWGKGFVEEASFALISELFGAGVSRLVATCAITNYSSMRVLQALNFEQRKRILLPRPQGPRESWLYELTPEQWRTVRLLPLGDGLSPEEIKQRRQALMALCREMKSARDYVEGGVGV